MHAGQAVGIVYYQRNGWDGSGIRHCNKKKMTQTVENLLVSFEQLTETEKHDLAVEVVRRSDIFGASELSDDEVNLAAEDLFLALDLEEAEAEQQLR